MSRTLCPIAVEAMRKLRDRVPPILTTGNTHCFTRTMCVALGTPKIFIAENGGVVSYSDENMELLADINICEEAFRELNRTFTLTKHDSRYRFTDIALARDFDIESASKRLSNLGLPVELIDTKFAVHIKLKGVDKGTGLLKIAEHLGISAGEIAAIGDSLSDIPMFRLAGFSAAVGNSDPELKLMASYVAGASYGSGFAEIIDFMIAEGLF
jgi:phosphoglycolate phosphatase